MDNIFVRPLTPEDWEILRAMRLRALEMHPGNYCGTYENEKKSPRSRWEDVSAHNKQIFGLFDGNNLIGITGVFGMEPPDEHKGFMGLSFIEPDYRGQGLSGLLYEARIDFAKNCSQWTRLVVSHREDNESSKRAIIKHGFQFIDRKLIVWPDGKQAYDLNYELDLTSLRTQQSNP